MRGEVAIGYLLRDQLPVINPPQYSEICFQKGDRVIVVSENDSESAFVS